jgi:Rps23 Pro-64 3,4-dihydroxylase Tpa1-like proline 4-hydroxylase
MMMRNETVARNDPNSTGAVDQGQGKQFVLVRDFLLQDELAALLEHTLSHEADFQAAEATPTRKAKGILRRDFRRARILCDLGRFSEIIPFRVRSYLPWVVERLGLAPFAVSAIRAQITGTNHNEFLKKHFDSATYYCPRKVLNFVYYFYREPKGFSGGELRLYRTCFDNGEHVFSDEFDSIVPRQNQVVFFPSWVVHEIRPVQCPSRNLADSRFTFNGELWKK